MTITTGTATTALKEFGRQVRNEPHYGIYKHRIFLTHDTVDMEEVRAWLKKRYVERKGSKGRLYRMSSYKHRDGNRYVDSIMLQEVTDSDMAYIRLRWGWSDVKVQRGDRVPLKRLNKDQAAILRRRIEQIREEFLNSLG